jgi:2-methylaconitate isomerase
LPLTASLCTAVAARIEGTLPFQVLARPPDGAVRLGMPSGILTVDAEVSRAPDGTWTAHSGALYRTTRRLFDGRIYVPRP